MDVSILVNHICESSHHSITRPNTRPITETLLASTHCSTRRMTYPLQYDELSVALGYALLGAAGAPAAKAAPTGSMWEGWVGRGWVIAGTARFDLFDDE